MSRLRCSKLHADGNEERRRRNPHRTQSRKAGYLGSRSYSPTRKRGVSTRAGLRCSATLLQSLSAYQAEIPRVSTRAAHSLLVSREVSVVAPSLVCTQMEARKGLHPFRTYMDRNQLCTCLAVCP